MTLSHHRYHQSIGTHPQNNNNNIFFFRGRTFRNCSCPLGGRGFTPRVTSALEGKTPPALASEDNTPSACNNNNNNHHHHYRHHHNNNNDNDNDNDNDNELTLVLYRRVCMCIAHKGLCLYTHTHAYIYIYIHIHVHPPRPQAQAYWVNSGALHLLPAVPKFRRTRFLRSFPSHFCCMRSAVSYFVTVLVSGKPRRAA